MSERRHGETGDVPLVEDGTDASLDLSCTFEEPWFTPVRLPAAGE